MLLTIVMKVGLVMKIAQILICILLQFVIITGHTESYLPQYNKGFEPPSRYK